MYFFLVAGQKFSIFGFKFRCCYCLGRKVVFPFFEGEGYLKYFLFYWGTVMSGKNARGQEKFVLVGESKQKYFLGGGSWKESDVLFLTVCFNGV